MFARNILSKAVSWCCLLSQVAIHGIDHSYAHIKFVCTTALIHADYKVREKEYIKGIGRIRQLGFMPYIVESCANGPTFLDELSEQVWYAKTNNYAVKNKGVNEVMALLNFFEHNSFDEDDIVIKVTGRYFFTDDSFLQYIAGHKELDAFVIYLKTSWAPKGDLFTGCFAMKHRFLMEFLKQLDLTEMEKNMMSVETEFARFIASRKDIHSCLLDKLGLMYYVGHVVMYT